MAGTLYLVATPIGNLNDLTPRAAATLAAVDFVAAEDTRVTRRLLTYLGLKKPLLPYHEHDFSRGPEILDRVEAGESCAVCSDAGMPCISDPGEELVREAHERGLAVAPIPAASAAATALAVSGQKTDRWVFEGFLPVEARPLGERLDELASEKRTVILYEAPHRLVKTLGALAAALGEGRSLTVCRELTKLHEEIRKTTVGEALAFYTQNAPRGEFVLVLAGAQRRQEDAVTLEEAVRLAQRLLGEGASASEAARKAARGTGFGKSEVYRALISAKEQE